MSQRLVSLLIYVFCIVVSQADEALEVTETFGTTADKTLGSTLEDESKTGVRTLAVRDGGCGDPECSTFEMEERAKRTSRGAENAELNFEDYEQPIPLWEKRELYSCASSPLLVSLPRSLLSSDESYAIPAVRIKQCNGCDCKRGKTCYPTETENVTFKVEVKVKKSASQTTILRLVTLPSHVKCECQCVKKCDSPRVLKIETCSCGCPQSHPPCYKPYKYNLSSCACDCNPNALRCDSTQTVDLERCRCVENNDLNNRIAMKTKPSQVVGPYPLVAPAGVEPY